MAEAETKNEQLVRRFFEEALNTGDLEKIRPYFHPDATWMPMAKSDIPGAGAHRGRKGIVDDFLGPVRGLFVDGDPKNEILSIMSKGDMVAVETHGTGTFRTGQPYDNRYAWFVEIKDDMIYVIREYMDTAYIQSITKEDNKKIALAYFDYITTSRLEEAFELLAEDATQWIQGSPRTMTKADIRNLLSFELGTFDGNPDFKVVATTVEGNRVAIECEMDAPLTNGKRYQNKYHVLVELDGGKIKRIMEYTDTAPARAAFSEFRQAQ